MWRKQDMSGGGFSKSRLTRMRDVMAGYVERREVPGLVLAVSRRGDAVIEPIGAADLYGPLDDTVPASRPVTVRDLLTFVWGLGMVIGPPGTYPIQQAMDELQLGQGPPDPAMPP